MLVIQTEIDEFKVILLKCTQTRLILIIANKIFKNRTNILKVKGGLGLSKIGEGGVGSSQTTNKNLQKEKNNNRMCPLHTYWKYHFDSYYCWYHFEEEQLTGTA